MRCGICLRVLELVFVRTSRRVLVLAAVALLGAGYLAAAARFGRFTRDNPLNEFQMLEPLLASYSGADEVDGLDVCAGF